ncbi:hypothetical protein PSPO_a0543 [Pseudoalteromonas spongiae UST010723-006]|nr:hypothetical protein PSPO_a0543 [Pseudoalteromonas spongiae UST010723-006]
MVYRYSRMLIESRGLAYPKMKNDARRYHLSEMKKPSKSSVSKAVKASSY